MTIVKPDIIITNVIEANGLIIWDNNVKRCKIFEIKW